jgi:hypothetical protein
MAASGQGRAAKLWKQHLQASLAHDNLINITARAIFEYLVARLLAEGWRPGHEDLFVAAREVFAWDKDRGRVMRLGPSGSMLHQAIEECEMFNQQSTVDWAGQNKAVARLRESAEATIDELGAHVPHLRNMRQRFPSWTAVIADTARLRQWDERERALPVASKIFIPGPFYPSGNIGSTGEGGYDISKYAPHSRSVADNEQGGGWGFRWWHLAVILLFIRLVYSAPEAESVGQSPAATAEQEMFTRAVAAATAADEKASKRLAGNRYIQPGERPLQLSQGVSETITQDLQRRLNMEEMQEILERIDYKPLGGKKGDAYKVRFLLELTYTREIERLEVSESSGLPGLDEAVAAAIRSRAPFSFDVRRGAMVDFTFIHQGLNNDLALVGVPPREHHW